MFVPDGLRLGGRDVIPLMAFSLVSTAIVDGAPGAAGGIISVGAACCMERGTTKTGWLLVCTFTDCC